MKSKPVRPGLTRPLRLFAAMATALALAGCATARGAHDFTGGYAGATLGGNGP